MYKTLKVTIRGILIVFAVLLSASCTGINTNGTVSVQQHADSAVDMQKSYYHFAKSRMYMYDQDISNALEQMQLASLNNPASAYLRYNLAILYIAADESLKAIDELEGSIQLDPDYHPPYRLLARIYSSSTDPDHLARAEEILKKFIEIDPNDYDSHMLLSLYYTDMGMYEEALSYLEKTSELKPQETKPLYYKAEIMREKGKTEEAEDIYRNILKLDPDNFNTLVTLAVINENLDRIKEAESYYVMLVENFPHIPLIYEEYGSFLYRTGRTQEAQDKFEKALNLDSSNKNLLLKLAVVYIENERYENAHQQLDSVLSKDSDNETAKYYKGVLLMEESDFEMAESYLGKIHPDSYLYKNAVAKLAMMHDRKGDMGKAEYVLLSGLMHDSDSRLLTNYLGQVYRKQNRLHKAFELYDHYLESNPEDITIMYSLGVVQFYMEDEDAAINTMRRILELDPEHADAMNFIGYTYADNGIRLDEAEELIRRALELSPDSGYIIDSLGWLYYRKGKIDKAIELIEEAAQLSPDDAVIKEHLGDAYMEIDNKHKALENYKEALELLTENEIFLKQEIELKERLEKKIRNIYKTI